MYKIMIILSFFLGTLVTLIVLRKKSVPANLIFYSSLLNLILTIYLALMVTYILSGATGYGFNSTGGAIGMLLGAFIISKIAPKYKEDFFNSVVLALPLMYGIGKIGCSFAGCCGGRQYEGVFHICTAHGNVFPVQILEAIVFMIIFAVSLLLFFRNKFNAINAAILYSMTKILLDFFRDTHENSLITANQIMCLSIVIILLVLPTVQKRQY